MAMERLVKGLLSLSNKKKLRMKETKLLIKGAIGNYNFGDDLLSFSICQHINLLDKRHHLTLISDSQYLYKHIENIKIVNYYNLRGSYDMLIYAGGTQFASFGKKNQPKIRIIKIIVSNLSNLNLLWSKIKNRIFGLQSYKYDKLAMLGIGIGPFFIKNSYYDSVISLLKKSDLISVRDKLSTSLCRENSISFIDGSDLVYSIPNSFWLEFKKQNETKVNIKNIGIIIRDWEHSKEQASFIYKMNFFLNTKYKIQFFSFYKRQDVKCIQYLTDSGFGNSITIWDPENMSFHSIISMLSKNDLLITARYHGAIVASVLNIPFISIGIEPKLTMVADLFKMPCWNYPYKFDDCLYQINDLDLNYNQKINSIKLQVEKEIDKNNTMMDKFNSMLSTI